MKHRSVLLAALGVGFLLSASAPAFADWHGGGGGGWHGGGGGWSGGGWHGGWGGWHGGWGGWHAGWGGWHGGWAYRGGPYWWGPRVVIGAPYYYYPYYYTPGLTIRIP